MTDGEFDSRSSSEHSQESLEEQAGEGEVGGHGRPAPASPGNRAGAFARGVSGDRDGRGPGPCGTAHFVSRVCSADEAWPRTTFGQGRFPAASGARDAPIAIRAVCCCPRPTRWPCHTCSNAPRRAATESPIAPAIASELRSFCRRPVSFSLLPCGTRPDRGRKRPTAPSPSVVSRRPPTRFLRTDHAGRRQNGLPGPSQCPGEQSGKPSRGRSRESFPSRFHQEMVFRA